jgi:hypothetical protein
MHQDPVIAYALGQDPYPLALGVAPTASVNWPDLVRQHLDTLHFPYVVHHGNCHDGITAAWVCDQRWRGDLTLVEGTYGTKLDLRAMQGRDVLFVDFSCDALTMREVGRVAKSVTVIDHHVTAYQDLRGLRLDCSFYPLFDMNRSGAGLAWDLLMPGQARPSLINYVEDRDLWRFALRDCREVHAACGSYPLTLEARSDLMQRQTVDLAREGAAILRYHDKLITEAAQHACMVDIGVWKVPGMPCAFVPLASDLASQLAVGHPFAAVWTDRPDGQRVVQLRSVPGRVDVGALAKVLGGGGGHTHASGFRCAAGTLPNVVEGPMGPREFAKVSETTPLLRSSDDKNPIRLGGGTFDKGTTIH